MAKLSATKRLTLADGMLLAAALGVMLFATGRWNVAAAAWIAPALLARFVRTQTLGRALAGGWVVLGAASFVWWRGVFPLAGAKYVIASIIFGFVALVPFLVDRGVVQRVGGLPSTLALPCAAVTIEILHSLFSPFGSWGSLGYSQEGNLVLLQLVSVTGLTGVSFLLFWFAAIVNRAWEAGFAWQTIRRDVLVYAAVLVAVVLFGVVRLQSNVTTGTVRVAAVTPGIPTYAVQGEPANRAVYEALSAVRHGRDLTTAQWESFRRRAGEIDEELLATTEQQTREGAKLVVWSEGAGIGANQDEASLIATTASLARQSRAWIELSFLMLDGPAGRTYENKSVLVDASGSTVWTYQKSHPVPGMEACVAGNGRVPTAPTPYGRVATVICFDADFPHLVGQAGAAGADILLVPADDWREIAPLHAAIVRVRAIEQGLAVVRATSNGFSTVVDRVGRVHARQDYFAGVRAMSADVPAKGARTIYTRIGDLFAWCCVGVLAALIVTARLSRMPESRRFDP